MVSAKVIANKIRELPKNLQVIYHEIPDDTKLLFEEFVKDKYTKTFLQYLSVLLYERVKFRVIQITRKKIEETVGCSNDNYPYTSRKYDMICAGIKFEQYSSKNKHKQQEAIVDATKLHLQDLADQDLLQLETKRELDLAIYRHISDFYEYLKFSYFDKSKLYTYVLIYIYFPSQLKQILSSLGIPKREIYKWVRRTSRLVQRIEEKVAQKIDGQVHQAFVDKVYDQFNGIKQQPLNTT